MSIEMENPQGALALVDAASNLIEQMHLAHRIGDEETFKDAHAKAGKFLHEAMIELDI